MCSKLPCIKSACVFLSQHTFIGPFVYFLLQAGFHGWLYEILLDEVFLIRYIPSAKPHSPATVIAITFYLYVRFKSPGLIPVVKLQVPIQSNDVRVQIQELQPCQRREVLEAQQDDESKLKISLDQFKDAPEHSEMPQNDTIRPYIPENSQKAHQMENDNHLNNDTKLILSGREGQFEILSSPSEQIKMATPNKQTMATCNYATQPATQIEKRFCLQCLNEQPFRAKHCRYCQTCIPMYDHHCPWIGVCIGEKNKLIFIVYLLVQIAQLGIGMEVSIRNEQIGQACVFAFFALLILLLLAFQVYYIMHNITTWEFLSSKNISYLRGGSKYLFDKGPFENFKTFFKFSCNTQLTDWQI